MKNIFRALLVVTVFAAVYYFIFWLVLPLVPLPDRRLLPHLISLAGSTAAAIFIWKSTSAGGHSLAACVLGGALILASLGFAAGFFGPIIFTPEASQGPLLGMIITGPLGFLAGGFAGLIYWFVRRKKMPGSSN